jgi:hypothetical protein
MLYQKLRPTGRVDRLNLPRLDGADLRWKDSTIATDTIAMYILSFNQERNAAKPISINVVFVVPTTYFARWPQYPALLKQHYQTVTHPATAVP